MVAWTEQQPTMATFYEGVRTWSERICQPLEIEDYVVQSMPEASPVKWHLAHTTWFLETFVLKRCLPGYQPDPHYSFLFNSYYNSIGPMHARPRRGLLSRPTVADVWEYRRRVDELMVAILSKVDEGELRDASAMIQLGLNHEQQHQELILTDLKHLLAQNPLRPAYAKPSPTLSEPNDQMRWIQFDSGLDWVGHEGDDFSFDNECPRHQVFLSPFELSDRLVTNGEFLSFIEDGAYQRPDLWLSLGWATVQEQAWVAPLYWEKRGEHWWTFDLTGMRPLSQDEPVCHVSFFEADAYARWAAARLPTEAEWEVASADASMEGNFAEAARWRPLPTAHQSSSSLKQMFGDCWEWTRSSYAPYPGYEPLAGAIGEYNGKFMCNQYVLRGGSCATPATHIRRTYRNFFPPDKRWQFSGIRLARTLTTNR